MSKRGAGDACASAAVGVGVDSGVGGGVAAPAAKKFRKGTGPPPGWVAPPPLTRDERLLIAQRNMSLARWRGDVGVAVVEKAKGNQWTGMGHSLVLAESGDVVLPSTSRGGEGKVTGGGTARQEGEGAQVKEAGESSKARTPGAKRTPRTTCLYPEEACYMVERNYLYLAEEAGDDPMVGPARERSAAAARGYALMVGAGVSLEVYRAYARMREQGWILRHDTALDAAVKGSRGFLLGAYLVYKPNSRFAKSRPGAPDFVLYCVADGAALPDVFQIHADGAQPEATPLLSAYRGGNVAFYRTSVLVNRGRPMQRGENGAGCLTEARADQPPPPTGVGPA